MKEIRRVLLFTSIAALFVGGGMLALVSVEARGVHPAIAASRS